MILERLQNTNTSVEDFLAEFYCCFAHDSRANIFFDMMTKSNVPSYAESAVYTTLQCASRVKWKFFDRMSVCTYLRMRTYYIRWYKTQGPSECHVSLSGRRIPAGSSSDVQSMYSTHVVSQPVQYRVTGCRFPRTTTGFSGVRASYKLR